MKLNYIEGLRGIGAILIFINHFVAAFLPGLITAASTQAPHLNAESPFFRANLISNGNFWVCIFFIITGFLLAYRIKTEEYSNNYLKKAIYKRYFRLLPLIGLSIFIGFVLFKLGLYFNKEAAVLNGGQWWLATLWNTNPSFFDMLQQVFWGSFVSGDTSLNSSLWTIVYEFWGVIIVCGVYWLLPRNKIRWIVLFIAILLTLNSYLLAFILGIILFEMPNWRKNLPKISVILLDIVLLAISFLLGTYPNMLPIQGSIYQFLPNLEPITNSFVGYHILGAWIFMDVITHAKILQRLLIIKPLQWFGGLSFSFYVMHVIIIASLGCFIYLELLGKLNTSLLLLLIFIITGGVSTAIAYLLHKYFEPQGEKLSGLLVNKITNE